MPETERCTLGQTNKTKVDQLREEFDRVSGEMQIDIREIKDKLLGRPSWQYVYVLVLAFKIIGILATITVYTLLK